MENLHPKESVIDRLRVSGEQSEEMLNTIFGAEVVAKYLEKEKEVKIPLFRSFREYSNLVEKLEQVKN